MELSYIQDQITKAIGARLSYLGMTFVELSKLTGIDDNKLSKAFSRRRFLKADEFVAICTCLDLKMDEIISEDMKHKLETVWGNDW